jgi:hypothetical protein
MMNSKTGQFMTLVAVLLAFGLLSPQQSRSEQSARSNCTQVQANSTEYLGSTCCTDRGNFRNGGILNGTTEYVYSPAFVVTPDPNVVSYISDFTLTANQGQLKASNVYIYDRVTGLWTAMGQINPGTSTGRFAGATGVLYFNGKTAGVIPDQSYRSKITAEICFAHDVNRDTDHQ